MNVDFDYLCVSSRLKLSEKEKNKLSPQLNRIVGWIAELEKKVSSERDIGFYQSLTHLSDLRKDKTRDSFSSRQAMANSPEIKNSYFSVPKVIKSK